MIDMTPLRDLAKNDEKLRQIINAEPREITEQEFLAKLSIFWNLAKR